MLRTRPRVRSGSRLAVQCGMRHDFRAAKPITVSMSRDNRDSVPQRTVMYLSVVLCEADIEYGSCGAGVARPPPCAKPDRRSRQRSIHGFQSCGAVSTPLGPGAGPAVVPGGPTGLPPRASSARFPARSSMSRGAPCPGADVTLTNQASRAVQHTTTNADGVFVFAAVPAGTYSVKVELQSFNSWEATDIALRLGERRALSGIKLRIGTLKETVSVTARPEIAPLDSGEKSARLTSEQIQNVPMVGRSTAELLKLLPGMTPISSGTSNSPGIQRRDHRDQRQRRRRQAERGRQLFRQRHPRRRARHRHRRRPRVRSGLQLRHVREPQPGHGRRVQGAAGELRGRARQGPDHHRRGQQGRADGISTAWATSTCATTGSTRTSGCSTGSAPCRAPRTSRRTSSPIPGSTSAVRCSFPGTNFNKNRDRVFFFTGYEFYRQRLDTGTLAVLGADPGDARRGLQQHGVVSRPRQRLRQHDADQSRERPHPGEPDRSQRPAAHQSLPAAQRGSRA